MIDRENRVWLWALSSRYIRDYTQGRGTDPSDYCPFDRLAEFFKVRNLMYFHPAPYDAGELEKLSGYNRVVCGVGRNADVGIDVDVVEESAAFIGRHSARFPNISGVILDDLSPAIHRRKILPEVVENAHAALKDPNPGLLLHAVVYTMHLDLDFSDYLPCIDVVSLWVWESQHLQDLDEHLDRCQTLFPEKPIHLGLYLYEYPRKAMVPFDRLRFSFEKAAQYLDEGRIAGIQVLGSYEAKELETEQAGWAARFLAGTA